MPGWFSRLLGGGDYGDPKGPMPLEGYGSPSPIGPGASGVPGLSTGLGWNVGTGQLALGALGSLGNLYSGFQNAQLARKQFNFIRDTTNTNIANQIKTYNTSLEDRARARGITEGADPNATASYIERNRLTR